MMTSWLVRFYLVFCILVLMGMAFAQREAYFPATSAVSGAYIAPHTK